MKKENSLVFAKITLVALFLGGCQTANNQQAASTVVGAIAGGVIGAQFGHGAGRVAGAAVGAIAGGLLGNALGSQLGSDDVRESRQAFVTASRAPVGQTIYWTNTRTGNWGTFRPIRDGHRRYDGYYCREFALTATIRGRVERVYGTACRHPNGTWQAI